MQNIAGVGAILIVVLVLVYQIIQQAPLLTQTKTHQTSADVLNAKYCHNYVIRSTRVVPDSNTKPAPLSVHVKDGKIVKIGKWEEVLPQESGCVNLLDVGNNVVMPGMVDTHVHGNDPGRTHWEGFEHVTKGAAAGGVTTILDMPLNSLPPTTSVDSLNQKMERAKGRIYVDVGFLGGIMPSNIDTDLIPMLDAGILGFKSFMINSGVEEFVHVSTNDIERAITVLKDRDVVYMLHAEVDIPEVEANNRELAKTADGTKYATFLATRPPIMEVEAIKQVANICDRSDVKTRCHIVHVATDEAFEVLKNHPRITAETCTHYLFFYAESIPDGATKFKCCPPIRSAANREGLWRGMRDGYLSMVTSDHSPSPPEMKNNNFLKSWGGISSLEMSLPALWTEAALHGFNFNDLVKWKCEEPAKLVKIDNKKGKIAKGFDADFVIWNPEESFVMNSTSDQLFHHRHQSTPYDGYPLRGVVKTTILRGNVIYSHLHGMPDAQGTFVLRE